MDQNRAMENQTGEESIARVCLEVTAGVMAGTPRPEYTKRWYLSQLRWNFSSDEERAQELAQMNGRATGYAQLLMLQPDVFNWVRVDWKWL